MTIFLGLVFSYFFFHFLMMTPALFSLSRLNEIRHTFENLIGPPHILVNEMFIVQFKKPVIQFTFFITPMTFLDVFGLLFSHLNFRVQTSFMRFLLVLFPGQSNVTFLSKKRFKIISRNYLFTFVNFFIYVGFSILIFNLLSFRILNFWVRRIS